MQRTILALALVSVVATPPLAAQEVRQQGNILLWPAYTDQQRWNRMTDHFRTVSVATISYAKSRGQSVEDVGRHFGELFAPGWGPANSGVPVRVARGFVFNWGAYPGSDAHLVSATDTSATMRYRRTYRSSFGPTGTLLGVTVGEYERMYNAGGERIAAHLGLRMTSRVDGDWMTITFTGKGSSANVAFPTGVFTQTLTPEQAGGAEFAGTFRFTFSPDGRFELATTAGESKSRGRYDVWLDQLTVGEETGPWACTGFGSGTYRFTPQTNGDVFFSRLSDACEGRARFFARRWVKQQP